MQKWLAFIEHFIDKIIPFFLIILLGIIVIDIFFPVISAKYQIDIEIADYVIIAFFIVDLIFKYRRARTIPQFIRKHWIDIIAIFPFFLVFRFFTGFIDFFETFKGGLFQGQKIVHIGAELKEIEIGGTLEKIGKEVTIVEEGGKITELTRAERLSRFLKPLTRSLRFGKATTFYEKPTHGKRHTH